VSSDNKDRLVGLTCNRLTKQVHNEAQIIDNAIAIAQHSSTCTSLGLKPPDNDLFLSTNHHSDGQLVSRRTLEHMNHDHFCGAIGFERRVLVLRDIGVVPNAIHTPLCPITYDSCDSQRKGGFSQN
jgi:hypothetical protein